jgi:hypothetical protein
MIEYVIQAWCEDCSEWDDIAFYETKELDEAKDLIDVWREMNDIPHRLILRKSSEEEVDY